MLSLKTVLNDIINWRKENDDTGWIETTGTLGNPVSYRRKNGWVYFQSNTGTIKLTGGSYVKIFQLPAGFYNTSQGVRLSSDGVGATTRAIVGRINSSGAVEVYSNENSIYFNVCGAFPVNLGGDN